MYASIDGIINNSYERENVRIFALKYLGKPIEKDSLMGSLQQDIDRTQHKLALARRNTGRYSDLISSYEMFIEDRETQIRDLESESMAVDGGPQRHKDNFVDPKGAHDISQAVNGMYAHLTSLIADRRIIIDRIIEVANLLDRYRGPERKRIYMGPGHTTLGNYEIELDIPGIPDGVMVVERYDFGGHDEHPRKGPHYSYDLVFKGLKPSRKKGPWPLGRWKKDSISLGTQEDFAYRIEGTGNNRKITRIKLRK